MPHPQSSADPVHHTFSASSFAVARLEDVEEIAKLRADLVACYQPVNSQELFALERMALAQQMILRAARLEAGLFSPASNHAGDSTSAENQDSVCRAFLHAARDSDSFVLFLRYQAQAERLYRRALEEFKRLKRLRSELPAQPGVQADAGEPTPVSQEQPLSMRAAATVPAGNPPVTIPTSHAAFARNCMPPDPIDSSERTTRHSRERCAREENAGAAAGLLDLAALSSNARDTRNGQPPGFVQPDAVTIRPTESAPCSSSPAASAGMVVDHVFKVDGGWTSTNWAGTPDLNR
jgi:hypothetical protein